MATYLDIGVNRIGEYLTRVPKLKQLRAASAAITKATTEFAPARGVLANPDAGSADGVLHLQLAPGADPKAEAVRLLRGLREALPAAHLRAWWVDAASYPEAVSKMNSREAEELEWLPSTNEFPVLRPCGPRTANGDPGCAQRPGMAQGTLGALCPDCAMRAASAKGSTRADEVLGSRYPARVRELALLPIGDRPPHSNHVAAVAMDGNGVGMLFQRLVAQKSTEAITKVSKALSEATAEAFGAAAATVVFDGRTHLIPVVLGGDDVIVILPATRAWQWALEFQRSFAAVVGERLGEDGASLSMTAGLVFHQEKEPITQSISLADDLMRHAKRSMPGKAAAAWIDTTSQALNGDAVESRPVVSFQALDDLGEQLGDLGEVRPSALNNLRALVQDLDQFPLPDDVREDAVKAQAARVGALSAVDPFPYRSDTLNLSTALDLVRWWR